MIGSTRNSNNNNIVIRVLLLSITTSSTMYDVTKSHPTSKKLKRSIKRCKAKIQKTSPGVEHHVRQILGKGDAITGKSIKFIMEEMANDVTTRGVQTLSFLNRPLV